VGDHSSSWGLNKGGVNLSTGGLGEESGGQEKRRRENEGPRGPRPISVLPFLSGGRGFRDRTAIFRWRFAQGGRLEKRLPEEEKRGPDHGGAPCCHLQNDQGKKTGLGIKLGGGVRECSRGGAKKGAFGEKGEGLHLRVRYGEN